MGSPVPILMYHSIDTQCSGPYRRWVVSPARFAEHMLALRKRGCTTLTMAALAGRLRSAQPLEPNVVAITFDDGLADFAENAVSQLVENDFSATLFITSGYVGRTSRWLTNLGEGDRPMLDWNELARLSRFKVELGAHTRTHPQLDQVSLSQAKEEVVGSKADIEQHLGLPVHSFAYPHGYSTPNVRRIVAEAGYTSACRVANALSATDEAPLGLSRIIMTEAITPTQLDGFIAGKGLTIAPAQFNSRMLAWRGYRRARNLIGSARQPLGSR